jgi:hypothetical protein
MIDMAPREVKRVKERTWVNKPAMFNFEVEHAIFSHSSYVLNLSHNLLLENDFPTRHTPSINYMSKRILIKDIILPIQLQKSQPSPAINIIMSTNYLSNPIRFLNHIEINQPTTIFIIIF